MKIRVHMLGAILAVLLIGGCTKDKKVYELIEKLEERVAALEKIVLPPQEEPRVQESAYSIPVGDSPVLGKKDASVNVVAFSNFQCPYCARADKALRELLKDPELAEKINVVFKHFPFDRHNEARPAAKAALAAGEQGKFWEMADKIFTNQGDMNEKKYREWAKELSLELDKFEKDLKDKDEVYNQIIDRDIKLGSTEARLEGTPWILINGWLLDGPISVESIKKLIKDKNL